MHQFAVRHVERGLQDLAEQQLGVARRDQLHRLHIGADRVAHEVRMQRWLAWGSRVVVLQNTPPVGRQLWWAAVLHAGPDAALASLTALEAAGLTGFQTDVVHVLVRRGLSPPQAPGVKVHESRRYEVTQSHPARIPRQVPVPRAAVDAASWSRNARRGCAILAAVVQQRLAVPEAMLAELDLAGQIRHRHLLRLALYDIEGGSQALSELDLVRLCRRFGLRLPDRQRTRTDRHGRRRYLDAEWKLPDGQILVLEVDGAHHLLVASWEADMKRQRAVTTARRTVLRCSAMEVRTEAAQLAADLVAAGVPCTSTVQLSGCRTA